MVLHAFTHAFATLLVPLYLLIAADLHLGGVKMASLLVTIYGTVYCLSSYFAGMLADQWNRKWLLVIGLAGNALAIIMIGLSRQYEWLLVYATVAGLCGALFHPAASTLVTAHYPKSPGMAIGLLGIGAGIGFFAGPQYAGWRAQTAHWQWNGIGDWQKPCIEMGIAGLVAAVLFAILAKEVAHVRIGARRSRPPLESSLKRRLFALAAVLGCRDFAGLASLSLASLYLQKAHGKTPKETGLIIGSMMLLSVICNPVAVWLTPGKRRLPGLSIILAAGGLVIATTSYWPVGWILAVLSAFQCFQLGSYAVGDAAILERVPPETRGRVVGLFLTLAGTFASLSPWVMGAWVDALGERSRLPSAYALPFAGLGALMVISAFSMPIIAKIGPVTGEKPIDPLAEVSPEMMEAMG